MEDTLDQAAGKHSWAQGLFLKSLTHLDDCCIEIRFRGETHIFGDANHPVRAVLNVERERFFARAVFGGEIGIGEAYMDGDWTSPDVVSVVRAAVRNMRKVDSSNWFVSTFTRTANYLRHLRNDNTETGSRKNIAYHYDLGNPFYSLFLDESLAYSCGHYADETTTLEECQERKFEMICRKLDLKSTDHLLEIGTGWGGFAAYAATHYGCEITTTTISKEQHKVAKDRFDVLNAQGLRIKLLLEDYRRLTGKYDKIVSIEMFEAVGHKHYDEYFGACDRLLKPKGMMLLQSITMNEQHFWRYLKASDWIKKYIFPGAELGSVSEILKSCARVGTMQMAHLEDIGEHYALTLREWRRRFMSSRDAVRSQGFDERFILMWEFYLAYCEGGFMEHYIGDAQILLAKPGADLGGLSPFSVSEAVRTPHPGLIA